MKEFYYDRKLLRNWTIVSVIILLLAFSFRSTSFDLLFFEGFVKMLSLCFCLSMFYVYMKPQRLAKIDDEGIIIDKNVKLKWSDIEKAERFKRVGVSGRDFIRFKLKKSAKYRLRNIQKLSALSKYGAFSIPLYAMTKDDAELIEKEIYKHLTVRSKIKNTVKRVLNTFSKSNKKTKRK